MYDEVVLMKVESVLPKGMRCSEALRRVTKILDKDKRDYSEIATILYEEDSFFVFYKEELEAST